MIDVIRKLRGKARKDHEGSMDTDGLMYAEWSFKTLARSIIKVELTETLVLVNESYILPAIKGSLPTLKHLFFKMTQGKIEMKKKFSWSHRSASKSMCDFISPFLDGRRWFARNLRDLKSLESNCYQESPSLVLWNAVFYQISFPPER